MVLLFVFSLIYEWEQMIPRLGAMRFGRGGQEGRRKCKGYLRRKDRARVRDAGLGCSESGGSSGVYEEHERNALMVLDNMEV